MLLAAGRYEGATYLCGGALFMREDTPARWDLIVSASWLGDDKESAFDYIVARVKSRLGERDLTSLSRIVVVDP